MYWHFPAIQLNDTDALMSLSGIQRAENPMDFFLCLKNQMKPNQLGELWVW